MSATGLLALNFCDIILLITSQKHRPITSRSLEYEIGFDEQKDKSYLTQISDVPYHVLIVYQNLYCSGSLIRSRVVVTAASCFVKMTRETTVIVKVGASTMTDIGQVIEVLEVKKHEYFGRASDLDNDIALLLLKEHVKFSNNVMKILLMDNQESIKVRTMLTTCGWGGSNLDTKYANGLLCTEMAVINGTNCWNLYKTFLSKSNFCVKYQQKFRLSDNGGPVVYRGLLVGLISYGADRKPQIALVTNITQYYRWINVNVHRLLERYCEPKVEYEYYYSSESEYSDHTVL